MGRPNPVTSLIRNWRKTIFIAPALGLGLHYTIDYTNTMSLMKASCKQVTRLGDEKLRNFNAEARHITVILNPVAGKRKAKKLYTKWVEPLLHLSGIKVSLVETESPNQARDLMKVMSNCDGVAIVGGDGTVHEVINGLVTRHDATKAAQQFPLAIIPAGQFNSIARMIYSDLRYRNYKEFLILSTLNLIESKPQKFDVLEIKDNDLVAGGHQREQPIYALRDVRYGKYQDNYYKVAGYMVYQRFIKPHWLKFRRFFGGPYCKPQLEDILYTQPCTGCSKCFDKHKFKDAQMPMTGNETSTPKLHNHSRWWTGLIRLSKPATPVAKTVDELEELVWAKNENPNCDRWFPVNDIGSISDIRACMMNDKKIRLSLARNGEYEPSEVIEVQDVRLNLASEIDKKYLEKNNHVTHADQNSLDDIEVKENVIPEKKDDKKDKFLIDRQPVDVHSIEITTLSKAIRIFTKSRD